MDDGYVEDEGIYEVEDLLEYKLIDGKEFYLVKWKGYNETSWEPDENIGQELAQLKEAAKRGGGGEGEGRKRKKEGKEGKKEKKAKKKRRQESSEEKKRKREDSGSESSKDGGMMHGMPPGFPGMPPGFPGMPPGMPGMPPMMFPPDMPGMPPGKGMPPGMPPMPPGMPPMPPGKGMPPMMGKGMPPGKGPMPPWPPPEMMGKGPMPPMPPMKGCKGKGKFALPAPPVSGNKDAIDMQRFAIEKKRRFRDLASSLHKHLLKETPAAASEEKHKGTEDFMKKSNLQLEEGQLPMTVSSEVIVSDLLWLVYLFDPDQNDEDRDLILNLANLAKVSNTRARQLLVRAFRDILPKSMFTPSSTVIQLFSSMVELLPKLPESGAENGNAGEFGPEQWRQLITQIYTEHNPSKLGDVDALLAKYRGRERTLYLGICEKYRVQPTMELKPMPGAGPPGQPPGSGPPSGAAQEELVKKYKELICEIYQEHNPSKLNDVDSLLAKYKGREELVYRGICDKYKVEPKIPKIEKKDGEGGDASKSVEKYKQLISEIYQEHNKEKLGEIDELLKKYSGKEKTLYLAVCHKYKIEPKLPGQKKGKKAAEADAEKAHEEKLKVMRPLIVEIYQEHKPEKLDDVDQLLAKYKGREELLYHGICEKYGVEPKIPKPAPAGATEVGTEGAAKTAADGSTAEASAGTAEGSAKEKEGGTNSVRQAYSDLIREVYREHNPSKLDSVDTLLGKYVNQEQDLYLTICKKYDVKPKDPEGLGDLEWLTNAEEHLSRLLQKLASVLVLHSSGVKAEDAQKSSQWEEVRPRAPPCTKSHRHELSKLKRAQIVQLTRELQGEEGARFRKLQDRCVGTKVAAPPAAAQKGDSSEMVLSVVCDSDDSNSRASFDNAITNVNETLARAVRDCLESDDEATKRERWHIPWVCEERSYISSAPAENGETPSKTEVGVEYRRGCWAPRKLAPLHAHSVHHKLAGPDVEGRLPDIWRNLADALWQGVLALTWGADMPVDSKVVIEVAGGHKAQPSSSLLPKGCSAAPPSASVVVTANTEEELEQAKRAVAPVLSQVLSDMRVNALFVPATLFMPQQKQVFRLKHEDSDRSESSAAEDSESEEVISDAEPTEDYRPLRLTRAKVRDAYLQGLLCLNCDAADHKHQDCPFRKKVCWNCHGNHPGGDCPKRDRFTKERHDYPLLESIKRVCRRVNDWKKSKPAQEQRSVLNTFEQLMIKMEGFEDLSLAKHNLDVQTLVKALNEQNALFPGMLADLAMSILEMKPPPKKKEIEPDVPPPPPPGAPPKAYVAPKLPKDLPPAMPENKYPWSEKIFLDSLLTKGMYGANVLSRIIGRGGMHHRRMESESGARVFFRGLGVSGRDMDLTEPIDCRLHISVKGDVPQQGQAVRRIIKEIVTEIDNDIAERGELGPILDRPRDLDAHPFGFLVPKMTGPEGEEPLKFRFPEEDGQTLNDLLVWLKQAKLPLELDSDTQWRTTLQITPKEPELPDDAPAQAAIVSEAFNKFINEWHYPCPYWFEEQDIRPTGLWSSMTTDGDEDCPILMQEGQSVRMSASAIERFATLLEKTRIVNVSHATVVNILSRLRGVVRRQAEDQQLLLYLAYPWSWFADSMGRGLKLPFTREQVHSMLVQLGRVGGKPTESNVAPPFRGFVVEWTPLKPGAGQELDPNDVAEAPPPQTTQPSAPQRAPANPSAAAPPRGFCKYWLPDTVFLSKQDLRELLAGPGGAHFGHVLKKYPSVDLRIEGQASATAPPAHRLHVSMSSEDSEAFESASADVLDLVETVCDMVGEELGYNEEQVEGLIKEVRAEKYFEAHGIRTPLEPARQAVKMELEKPAPPVPTMVAAKQEVHHGLVAAKTELHAPSLMAVKQEVGAPEPTPAPTPTPTPVVPSSAPHIDDSAAGGEFEFIDEDFDMGDQAVGGDDDDDARTEASDALSDLTEPEDGQGKLPDMTFDDI